MNAIKSEKERLENIKHSWVNYGELSNEDISWLVHEVESKMNKELNEKMEWLRANGYEQGEDGYYVFHYDNQIKHSFMPEIVDKFSVGTLELYHNKFLIRAKEMEGQEL